MKKTIIWNDGWVFKKTPGFLAPNDLPLENAEPVVLPHTWYRDGEYYRGNAVYQKQFKAVKADRTFIRFHGVDKVCRVFVNGRMAGEHRGGYSIFCLEITGFLNDGQENLITVQVNNETGKTVNPLSGDFTVFGGIHRKVEMVLTDKICFDPTWWGTEGVLFEPVMENESEGFIRFESRVLGAGGDTRIQYELWNGDGMSLASVWARPGEEARMKVSHPHLWNGRQDPYLYQVTARVFDAEQEMDSVTRQVGFRTVRIDAGNGFFLNGRHIRVNGVAKHQDSAGVFSAVSETQLDQDMALIEEIGANAIRLSHYQHPQYFMDLCDHKGMLVWAEIPLLKLTPEEALLDNAKQQLQELIYQNMHRPSIVMWGLQNEIAIFGEFPYMYEGVQQLHKLAKKLDPYRLTTSANLNSVGLDSPLNRITDVVAYNLYYGWYYGCTDDMDIHLDAFHRLNPKVPLGISEYGADCNTRFHSAVPKVKDYSEEFQAWYHETMYPKFRARPFVWGSFVWNMFDFVSGIRDEGGVRYRNNKGLVTHDRKTRKDGFYYYKAVWSEVPFVHIAEQRFMNRPVGTFCIKVYSNLSEVSVILGGREYTCQSDSGVFLFPDMEIREGRNEVLAVSGDCRDQACFIGVSEPDASYVYVDPNPGLNVKNWFADEVERERLFPADAFSIMNTINDLLADSRAMAVIDRLQPQVGAFMRDTIGTFTLEKALNYNKTLCSEENVKELNAQLTAIQRGTFPNGTGKEQQ